MSANVNPNTNTQSAEVQPLGDTDNPGASPDEVQPDEGGDVDDPDPGEPDTQPDEGDVDEPGSTPQEMPAPHSDPLINLPPD